MPYWFAILVAITSANLVSDAADGAACFTQGGAAVGDDEQIYVGMVPFVLLQLACVAVVLKWPALVTVLPRQIFG